MNSEIEICQAYNTRRTKFLEVLFDKYFQSHISFTIINNMASLVLWKMLYLPELYQLQMAPVLCDLQKMGCHVDGEAMLAHEMPRTC